jgi:hypothetical protein
MWRDFATPRSRNGLLQPHECLWEWFKGNDLRCRQQRQWQRHPTNVRPGIHECARPVQCAVELDFLHGQPNGGLPPVGRQ